MYKWKIEITLSCGKEIVGWIEGVYKTSMNVATGLFTGKSGDFCALNSMCNKKHLFVKLGDISHFAISALEE